MVTIPLLNILCALRPALGMQMATLRLGSVGPIRPYPAVGPVMIPLLMMILPVSVTNMLPGASMKLVLPTLEVKMTLLQLKWILTTPAMLPLP